MDFKVLTSGPSDDNMQEQPSSLLFGVMGIATFIFFFFMIVIGVVWVFTTACPVSERLTIRGIFMGVFGVIIIILLFADREPRFVASDMEPHIYDNSIIPRVAVSLVMAIFGIVSVVNLIDHFGEAKKLSSINQEITALWQD